jgi:hypothetical protein
MRHLLIAVLLTVVGAGCEAKPTEAECKKALENTNKVLGITNEENMQRDMDTNVRRCRAEWSKKAVRCAAAAQTKEALDACEGGKK